MARLITGSGLFVDGAVGLYSLFNLPEQPVFFLLILLLTTVSSMVLIRMLSILMEPGRDSIVFPT